MSYWLRRCYVRHHSSRSTNSRLPVPGLSAERRDCQDNDFVFANRVDDGKFKFAWDDTASSEFVWETCVCEFGCQCLSTFHRFVKTLAEMRACGREVNEFVQELFTRLVDISNSSQR